MKPPLTHPLPKISRDSLRAALLAASLVPLTAGAVDSSSSGTNELSLEQLVNITVTTVSRKETSLESSPAAISVITQDDINRLGIESIPEALSLVPGMDVAQINSHEWAVGARGFNDQYANKLLVLIDGMAVYTPTFGGVFWDSQDLPMEDIDRIEAIRGPGGTLWGANAVDGVVNVITKSAKDTQGLLVSAGGGTWDRPVVMAQFGGQLDTNLYYRTYVKYFNRDSYVEPDGNNSPDSWDSVRGGARIDWEPQTEDHFTIQGDGYTSAMHENVDAISYQAPYWQSNTITDHQSGGNVLGRWTHDISDTSQLSVQAYDNYWSEEEAASAIRENTFDLDAQHRFGLADWNDVVWGLGYRFNYYDFLPSSYVVYNEGTRHDQLFSGFVQDEITLVPDRLHFTAGTKLEHNDYTGFEYEPSARLAWTPTDRQTVWAAVSRAVRTPAIFNLDGQVNETYVPSAPTGIPMPIVESIYPNTSLKSEQLYSYEFGYRVQPVESLSLDLAGFYDQYRDLIIYVPGTPTFAPPGQIIYPVSTQNGGSGQVYGTELSAQWKPLDNLRLMASYSWIEQDLAPKAYLTDTAPEQQAQARAYLDLPHNLQFNGMVSYVDKITSVNIAIPTTIPSDVRLDLGLVWRPVKSLELGIWGQNLLQARHAEFASETTTILIDVPRSVFAKITWNF